MRVKGKRVLKNGAVAGYVYYSNDRKWKWRIIGHVSKKKKGGVYIQPEFNDYFFKIGINLSNFQDFYKLLDKYIKKKKREIKGAQTTNKKSGTRIISFIILIDETIRHLINIYNQKFNIDELSNQYHTFLKENPRLPQYKKAKVEKQFRNLHTELDRIRDLQIDWSNFAEEEYNKIQQAFNSIVPIKPMPKMKKIRAKSLHVVNENYDEGGDEGGDGGGRGNGRNGYYSNENSNENN
jgi:hypothetical protein